MRTSIIVGGGIYGTAVARALAARGQEVQLLEALSIASGASGGPGRRGVRASYRDHRELPLMVKAREIWPRLHEDLGTAALFEQTGHLTLIERPSDLPQARVQVALQNRLGIPTTLLSADELREREPHVAASVQAAVFCPDDGVADHGATTTAMAASAVAAGATIREGVTVDRLRTRDDEVVALETCEGDEIPVSGDLFLLANSGVRELVHPWVDLPTWDLALQVLVSTPLSDNPVRHLVGHAHRTLSLKRETGGRLMISGGRLGRWDATRKRGEAIPEEVAANVADAVAVYPALTGLEVDIADANHLEAISIDDIPLIDRVPQLANAFMATGWCGHGWAIAPVVAELIAEWALEGQRPALLAPFGVGRLG